MFVEALYVRNQLPLGAIHRDMLARKGGTRRRDGVRESDRTSYCVAFAALLYDIVEKAQKNLVEIEGTTHIAFR